MTLRNAIRRRLAGNEDGYVMIVVLWTMVIVLLIGLAVVAFTLSGRSLTNHDLRVRRAQQSAEAGAKAQQYTQEQTNLSNIFNLNGGVLGLGTFLDCVVPKLNVNLQVTAITQIASAAVGSAGVCPGSVSSGTGAAQLPQFQPLSNHAWQESEYFSNEQGSSVLGSAYNVEFPEIVSVGCDTVSATAAPCSSGSSQNAYARDLQLFAPTGPLQAVEGAGNVTINGLSLLGIPLASVVDGDVIAGGSLALPVLGVGLNTQLQQGGLIPTFGYGTTFTHGIYTGNVVHLTSGSCVAGSPSTTCYVQRPAPQITPQNTTTPCALCSTGITCTGTCTGSGFNSTYDTFNATTGSWKFAAGDYTFCNFSMTGSSSITITNTTATPTRFFILPPNSGLCSTNGSGSKTQTNGLYNGGNFIMTSNNLLSSLTNITDPSTFQVYVQGDGSYDNATTVSVGTTNGLLSSTTISGIFYAPTSNMTISSTTFDGSAIGDNVTLNSATILQDLDLGNYPLYGGALNLQPTEFVQCDNSVKSLTNKLSDANGC